MSTLTRRANQSNQAPSASANAGGGGQLTLNSTLEAMMLPRLTQTKFQVIPMKEVVCEFCGYPNHWVLEAELGPFYCSQLCQQQASSPSKAAEEKPPTTDEINQALEQRTGDEVI